MNKQKVVELFPYVNVSLHLCKEAFNELWYITQVPITEDEISVVSGRPFVFYGLTLQYCIIMEYTKLLETKSENSNENVASVFRLNNSVNKLLGDKYIGQYKKNRSLLKDMLRSALFERLKNLRNKKFGHSEMHMINDPMKIRGFSEQEFVELKKQIDRLTDIINDCSKAIGEPETIFIQDDRTKNFIKYHAVYKKYYNDNFQKAYDAGYKL